MEAEHSRAHASEKPKRDKYAARRTPKTCCHGGCSRPVHGGDEFEFLCLEHYNRMANQIAGLGLGDAFIWFYEYSDGTDPRQLRLVTSQDLLAPPIRLDVEDLFELADQINEWRETRKTMWERYGGDAL